MLTLEQVLTDALRREGWPTVTDAASDRGGLTKGGITLRNYNAWRVREGHAAIDADTLRALPEDEARRFLRAEFLAPLEFVQDEGIFAVLADWAIMSGVDDPVKALQKTLRARGLYMGGIDGVPGTETKAAWRTISADLGEVTDIEAELIVLSVEFCVDIVLHDPIIKACLKSYPETQAHNLRGWVRRKLSFISPIAHTLR